MEHNTAPVIMRNEEIVNELRQIKTALYTLREGIRNRKGMRESERAMTLGALTHQMEALDAAAQRVLLRNDQMPLVVYVLEHVARQYVAKDAVLLKVAGSPLAEGVEADLKTIDDALASATAAAHLGGSGSGIKGIWPGSAAKA